MKIISFAWTTPALLAGRKTKTRRHWATRHIAQFKCGDLIAGYNRLPRVGGKQVAVIRLTADPYSEPLNQVKDSDWEDEGFAYLSAIGARVNGQTPEELWQSWLRDPTVVTVICFEVVQIL